MDDFFPRQDWPVNWAENVRIDFGEIAARSEKSMLLFSGMGVSAFLLRPIELVFREKPVRMRLQSLPGHSGNSRAFHSMTQTSFVAEAEQCLSEMVSECGPIDLGGFSAGGVLACLLAARNPTKVKSLSLIGFCPKVKGLFRRMVVSSCGLAARVPVTRSLMRYVGFRVKSSGRDRLMHPLYGQQPRYRRYSAAAFGVLAYMQSQLPRAYSKIRVPVRFYHGGLDERSSPEQIAEVVRVLQKQTSVSLKVYNESPHCIMLGPEAPQFLSDFREMVLRSA